MHEAWVRVLAIGALLAVVGCADSEPDEPRTMAEGVSRYCEGYCSSARRCVETDSGCERRCNEGYEPVGVRPSALGEVGRCMLGLKSCESWATETPTAPCWEQVALTTEPKPVVVDYCESASLEYFECGAWWGVDECLSSAWLWDDDVLNEARACHTQACDELFACESAIWERY
jgi:hypothetical protein